MAENQLSPGEQFDPPQQRGPISLTDFTKSAIKSKPVDQFGHGLHQGLANNQGYQNPPLGRQGALARARSAPWRGTLIYV